MSIWAARVTLVLMSIVVALVGVRFSTRTLKRYIREGTYDGYFEKNSPYLAVLLPTILSVVFSVVLFGAAFYSSEIIRDYRTRDLGPAPHLAPVDSGALDGGHTQSEVCGPRRESYAAQYPDWDIVFTATEDSDKDWLGHVTYHYHCNYVAKPKL